MIRRLGQAGQNGFMTIGRSKAKVYMEKDVNVRFTDVAGVDEAKEELQEVIDFLKTPARFGRLGAKLPKGVLLVGPPGTGKTLLARAIAGEAGVPFFSISGSDFVEMFVGVGAARVRDLFEQAKQKAPCIIFIDELDALGKARGMGPVAHEEREQTLNQLLVELDGFDARVGVILVAATNRPEILDPALLRAGRFDRQVLVDRPDKPARLEILKLHARKVTMESSADLDVIAQMTAGFVGADLANIINEAALLGVRQNKDKVGHRRAAGGGRTRRRRAGEEEPRAVARREEARRLPRAGTRAGGDGAARQRQRPQDLDHPARRRGARLHDAAADRGPLPDDRKRAGEQGGDAAGRTRRRGADLRRGLDRRARRPEQGDRHRAQHGQDLRHEPAAGAGQPGEGPARR